MGTLVNAYCNRCSFKKKFSFGAGMSDFTAQSKVPAIDQITGEFVVKNYFEKESYNDRFVFYNDQKMFTQVEEEVEILQWGDVFLSPAHNYCPKCHQYDMDFAVYAYFD